MKLYNPYGKRLMDIAASGIAVMFLSPVLILTAVLILLEDGPPIFFVQTRVGRGGRDFRIFKFRSMPINTPNVTSDKAQALRVTRVGEFIRRTNIDELPQLLNILRGDMSVVGPRPALPAQEVLTERRRLNGALECTPGLTGLAQVRAFDGMTVEQKASMDGEYAGKITLFGDVEIILSTFAYLRRPPPVY